MKALRIATELKLISMITLVLVGYLWTHSISITLGIFLTETVISLFIQSIWLVKRHNI